MTKKDIQQALIKSIEHWTRMRDAAKKYDPDKKPHCQILLDDINETWISPYCALCRLFSPDCSFHYVSCPLDDVKNHDCCVEWFAVVSSLTWRECLANMEKMIIRLQKELNKINRDLEIPDLTKVHNQIQINDLKPEINNIL